MFALASVGTYMLSHKIELRGNAAAAFLSSGQNKEIALYEDRAEPASVTLNQGDEIAFVVKDQSFHDMAEERTERHDARLESGQIGKDESYSLVFNKAGSYSFYDRMHQDIRVDITIR